jgi:hypothetical protein
MTGGVPLDPQGWPETPEEVRVWYHAGEKWMAERGKRRLSALAHRLWEIAAAGETIEYTPLAKEFNLAHRGTYSVAWWSGLVSAYSEQVMGHVFLSAVVVNASSKSAAYPKGLPGSGYNSHEARTKAERIREGLQGQAKAWEYCSTHPNPFPA